MAILKGGPNGPFSGKVGSVVGSNCGSVDYIKGLTIVKKHKPSEAQIIQRQRFPHITTFLYQVQDALNKGWDKQKKTRTNAINDAVSYNSRHALHPGCGGIMFHRIKISDGALPKPSNAKVTRINSDTIRIDWNPAVRSFSTCAEDEVTIVIFCPKSWTALVLVGQYLRRDGEAAIMSPIMEDEDICHAYIFFTSPKGVSSPTFYMKVPCKAESEEEV
ncbi:DUF6266 family protein [Arcticibacter sp.]|uniref:DUF6266 family protein n=1 Tax=Arcticibacter sp. TaxID=1872630 RepID=UPI00388FC9E3